MTIVGVTCKRCGYRYVYGEKCPRCSLIIKEEERNENSLASQRRQVRKRE